MTRTTKVTATVIMPVLLAAFVILFGFPRRTEQLWAWTIAPPMTAITVGAGYLGGVAFFARVARARQPHRVVGGLAAATVFTTMLGVATFVHWDKFNHDHVSFWAWLFLYTVSPGLLAVLVVGNRRLGRPAGPDDPRLPRWARTALPLLGGLLVLAAVSWFLHPPWALQIWPWTVTPLTARTLASFVGFTGALLLWPLVDDRRDANDIGLLAVTVGLAMVSIGAVRGRADFTGPVASRVVYVCALALLLAMVLWLQRPAASPAAAPRTAPA
ncbi:MAG TPA: hypothetical protein VFO65_02760 [Acidimicrobiales bacterium]|nr:hypothetical protein [Acidimicrobiales bacterium]